MKKVAIIGLGLMGGSLGLAVKKKGCAERVCGFARRVENRKDAFKRKIVDAVFDSPAEAVKGAELVLLCVPVLAIPEMAKACKPGLADNCVVTDVGSTKSAIVAELSRIFSDIQAEFIGSHPMAGSDESGLDAARADLYDGAVVIVTPDAKGRKSGKEKALSKVKSFWKAIGAEVTVMNAEAHDEIIARTSHLPHLVAAMLVNNLGGSKIENISRFCGPGFRDTTRIAGGSENIWHDVVKSNKTAVSRELEEFSKILERVRKMIDKGDFDGIKRFLGECRKIRRSL